MDKGRTPFDVPTRANILQSQRLIEQELREKAARDSKLSPLDKAYAALEAARTIGSGVLATIGSLPTRAIKGEDAAQQYINQRMFIPTTEKGMDYVGNVGDFLEQLETKYKLPPVLPEAVVLQNLVGPASKQAAKTVKTNIANMPPSPPSGSLAAQRGVIKMPGGNWLKGNIEPSLEKLKSPKTAGQTQAERIPLHERLLQDPALNDEGRATVQRHLDATKQAAALDNWVGGNLPNYVKKQMATPNDPVRALHEQGITHLGGQMEAVPMADASLKDRRAQAGFDKEGLAQSEMAKQWESLADESIWATQAKEIQKTMELFPQVQQAERAFKNHQLNVSERFDQHIRNKGLSENQIQTLNEKTPISDKARIIGDTKYDDLWQNYTQLRTSVDIPNYAAGKENPWINKVNPETPLYSGTVHDLGFDHIIDVLREDLAAGRIRPEQLNKVSMEQAVRRTYEYDQEMARKMAEAQIKATEGMPIYKDYADKGYKWIELAAPDSNKFEESIRHLESNPKEWQRAIEEFRENRQKNLESALKYEGDTMGHCVGGYCPDVLEGRGRIFSLRDAKGEPHVTVEIQPHNPNLESVYAKQNLPELYAKYSADRNKYFNSWPEFLKAEAPELLDATENKIVQIKGKQNAAPKAEYLPFVQDFVRSGNWSDVGDFKNTGLIKQDGKYMTQAEYDDYLLNQLQPPPVEGMKRGGKVSISDNCDCQMMELEDQKFATGGMIGKAVKSAIAARELEKQAILRAEAAAKSAAKQALMPKYNEAVKGQTQKQNPPSFEQWKAANVPQKQTLNLSVKPPSDNIANVIDANFYYPKKIGNQTVKIGDLSGGVRMNDPTEAKRVKDLAEKMSSPDGYISRIIVDHNNNVIEGQHRLEALRQLGMEDVPVYKIEDLSETMPVNEMESAVNSVGGIHPDNAYQLVRNALEHISEGNIDSARQMNYGKWQKHYDAALNAIVPKVSKASGGAVYNTYPDMSDGGQMIQGAPFKKGGNVNDVPKPKFIPLPAEFDEPMFNRALDSFRGLANQGLNATFPLRKIVSKASNALLDDWQERTINKNPDAYLGKHAEYESDLANFHIKNAIRKKFGIDPIALPNANIEDIAVLNSFPETIKKAGGGDVNLDAMYIAVNDAKFRRK